MKKIFFFNIFLFLLLTACSDRKDKAILNCADDYYVEYANLNPHLFVSFDFTHVIEELGRREIILKSETLEEKKRRQEIISESKKKDKQKYFVGRDEYYDLINKYLIIALNNLETKELNIIENKNLYKSSKDYKIKELRYYSKFYQLCFDKFNSFKNDSEKEKFLKVFENFRIEDSKEFDISKIKVQKKERNLKLINLLKKYSEIELFINKFKKQNEFL